MFSVRFQGHNATQAHTTFTLFDSSTTQMHPSPHSKYLVPASGPSVLDTTQDQPSPHSQNALAAAEISKGCCTKAVSLQHDHIE
ncbi:hypothetical protein Hanom_Chr14g01248021 [Helianthus anomalus]